VSAKYTVLSITTLGVLMTALDSTIVYLAVPAMESYFNTGIAYLTLVIVVYLIATTSTMIPSGSLATRYGRRNLYLGGFLLFTVSSLLIAISPGIILAVIFRALEGVGAGMMGTVGIPILLEVFPPEEHGKAIGINSVAWSIGALLGPVLGGFLVTIDWRYIFLVNIPIGVAALSLGSLRIPRDKGRAETEVNTFNVAGFLLFLVPLSAGISFLNPWWVLLAGVMLPLFAYSQLRAPLVPRGLLSNRRYVYLVVSTSLQTLAFFGVIYALSVYLQNDRGMNSFEAGIVLAANPVASIIASPIGGLIYDRLGRGTTIMLIGLAIQASSVLITSIQLQAVSLPVLGLLLFLSGVGGSLFWTPSTVLAMNVGGAENRSVASGTVFTLRNIALVVGLASFPVFIESSSPSKDVSILLTLQSGLHVLQAARLYLAVVGLLSLVSIIFILLFDRIHLTTSHS
jgi:MFS family permease